MKAWGWILGSIIIVTLLTFVAFDLKDKKNTVEYSPPYFSPETNSEVNDNNELIITETKKDIVSTKAAAMPRRHTKRRESRLQTEDIKLGQQAMEEAPLFIEAQETTYWDKAYFPDSKLDRIQKEEGIFFGYPGATGASGAPGSADIER
jgi:hypothetical protein